MLAQIVQVMASIREISEAIVVGQMSVHYEPHSITLHESQTYLGAYMVLRIDNTLRLRAHVTIGHWAGPGCTACLRNDQKRRLLLHIENILARPMVFAAVPPIFLGHRQLLILHVRSALSMEW